MKVLVVSIDPVSLGFRPSMGRKFGTTVEKLRIASLLRSSPSSISHITHEHTKVLDNGTYISIFLLHPNVRCNLD